VIDRQPEVPECAGDEVRVPASDMPG